VLARVLWACQHGSPPEASSRGASTWSTGDRPGVAVVQNMPGQEAVTHLILGKGEV
jgi:hypothetical protein